MADCLFPSTAVSAKKLETYGISVDNISQYGCPSVDQFLAVNFNHEGHYLLGLLSANSVGHAIIEYGNYHFIMIHPKTDKGEENFDHTLLLIDFVKELKNDRFLWFWPNTDPSNSYISKGLRVFRESENCDNVRFIKNLSPDQFF